MLIRRLRLQNSTGHDITDIDRVFKDKDTIIFYAGSEHGSRESRARSASNRWDQDVS
jgi:hypothetical protein